MANIKSKVKSIAKMEEFRVRNKRYENKSS